MSIIANYPVGRKEKEKIPKDFPVFFLLFLKNVRIIRYTKRLPFVFLGEQPFENVIMLLFSQCAKGHFNS